MKEAPPSSGASEALPSPPVARALIRSLSRGTAIARGVRYIHVGHDRWLAAQRELLAEIDEDGHAETKFVRGAYGAGKSHFLAVVQDRAREAGWITAHLECKTDRVQIDRFETVYPQLVAKLLGGDIDSDAAASDPAAAPDALRMLLDRWTQRELAAAGVKSDGISRPFDADARLYRRLQAGLLRSNLPPELIRAVTAFSRASLVGDDTTMAAVCQWMRAGGDRVRLPGEYFLRATNGPRVQAAPVDLRPVNKGTVHEAMRGLLWLIRAAGYRGLVLCIDEIEEIAKLGNRKRLDQALQALRELVDHAGGEGGFRHLCVYLAATPEMFEGPDYFPRYDALATRIQPIGKEINWRAPVVDLDQTPLDAAQMHQMAAQICAVHRVAYGKEAVRRVTDDRVQQLVDQLPALRTRIAKPRLLARTLVDELERARQTDAYKPAGDVTTLLQQTAAQLLREASQ